MKSKKTRIGGWVTIPSEIIVEIFCDQNYDFIVIDLEHSIISLEQCQNLIRVIQNKGKEAIVRISNNDLTEIKRVLDSGADGIIIPMVNEYKDVENIVKASLYPPEGERGVGLARANKYGKDFDRYITKVRQKEIELIVQFENIKVMSSVDKILSNKFIDGYMIGPYDFTASMGYPGDFENKEFLEAIAIISDKNEKHKKYQGFHLIEPDLVRFNELKSQGYNFIIFSLDVRHLIASLSKINR
tara:strand:+ start:19801 stop:20529 length:729 start_codon:yes stop_codon:yes gene_type:complete